MARPPPDPSYILRGANSEVTSLVFKPDVTSISASSSDLISGTLSGAIHWWDGKTKRIKKTIEAHGGESVLWLAICGDTKLLSQGRDGELVLWEYSREDWRKLGSASCANLGFCRASLLTGDPDIVAVPSPVQGEICIVSIPSLRIIHTVKIQQTEKKFGMCMTLKLTMFLTENQTILIGGYESGSLVLVNISEQDIQHNSTIHEESVMALDYNSKINKGVSGSVDNVLKMWTLSQDFKLQIIKDVTITNAGISSVTIREDGKLFVTGGWDHQIRIFGMKKMNALAVLSHHSASIHCTAFAGDHTLAAGSKDKLITVWDVYKS